MDTIEKQAETANATFPLIKCAGFYIAVLQILGPENLSAGYLQMSERRAVTLLAKASQMRTDDGVNVKEAIDSSSREAQGFSLDYIARAADQVATTGHPFASDNLAKADIAFCKRLGEDLFPSTSW